MIFVTVGTQLPFDRLMRGVDLWAEAHPEAAIFAQTSQLGPGNYVPRFFESAARLTPAEFERHCAAARCIVAHAGTGSLISAMTLGKPVLVMPRRAELHEHRNDHQMATAKYFGARPGIYVAHTEQEIGTMLDHILGRDVRSPTLTPFAEERLLRALRDVIVADNR